MGGDTGGRGAGVRSPVRPHLQRRALLVRLDQQNIPRLEVAVHDTVVVQVSDSLDHLQSTHRHTHTKDRMHTRTGAHACAGPKAVNFNACAHSTLSQDVPLRAGMGTEHHRACRARARVRLRFSIRPHSRPRACACARARTLPYRRR
eukprot:1031302-Pleurochrysis_carterae.AAC.2